MKRSFFSRLFAGFVVLILVTVAAISLFIHQATMADSLDDIEQSLRKQAIILAEIARPHLAKGLAPQWEERVAALGQETGTRLTVINKAGKVLADSAEDPSGMGDHSSRPEIRQAAETGTGMATRYSRTLEKNMRYFALRVDSDGVPVGFVRTSLPLDAVNRRLAVLRGNVLLGTLIAIVLSLPLAYFLARRVSKPLSDMTLAAQAIASGKDHSGVRPGSTDEIGKLADALNEMAERLSQRMSIITQDRNQLQAMLSSMTEGVIAVDRESRIAHLNNSASELCQVEPSSATGMHTWEALRVPELDSALEVSLRKETTVKREITLVASRKVYAVTIAPWRDGSGDIVGAVIAMHDISGIRDVERMRQEFITNASHELKSPLTAIRGMAETMAFDNDMSGETREHFSNSILQECERLTRLVQDMLALSRAESGAQCEAFSMVDLNDAAADAFGQHSQRAETASIELKLQRSSHPANVQGSREALATAIGNLLENAISHSPTPGVVEMSVHCVDGEGIVRVRDYGPGIAGEHHARLFERFYRVDKARSREMGGTGLGLAIVKHTALSHGGKASVDSSPGQGSSFSIALPLHKQD